MIAEKLSYDQIKKYGPGKRKKLTYRLQRGRRDIQKYRFIRTEDGVYQYEGREGCCGKRKLILRPLNMTTIKPGKVYDVAFLVI